MKRAIKYITGKTLRPLVSAYLSKERRYCSNGISLNIPPQVFHPAFFFSTTFLLQFIKALPLGSKRFLELGAGSGLIAFTAAKKGATVTASDINRTAIEFLQKNAVQNNLSIEVIESDLFARIPKQQFDVIAINPPYYKKDPVSDADYAWYCGENSGYFINLFKTIGGYINESSRVFMILNEECDLELITGIAARFNYKLVLVASKRKAWEMNYIFKIEKLVAHV